MPTDDYIKRSDALEIAMEWCPDDDGSVGKVGDLREMLDEFESIPAADVEPKQRWTPVEEGLPQERDTIFARFYGTEKWKPGMIRRISDDVRVVAVFKDGTAMVWHDHTVDGVWSCEKDEINPQRKITHWMENPELPKGEEDAD